MQKQNCDSRVGGWLSLLIFILMILIPVAGIYSVAEEFSAWEEMFPAMQDSIGWFYTKAGLWILACIYFASSFIAGYKLWRHHYPETVTFVIRSLWFLVFYGLVINLVSAIVVQDLSVRLNVESALDWGEIFRDLLTSFAFVATWAIIWTLYLKKSVRIRNTYRITAEYIQTGTL